jgi:SIR2-like domain
LIKVFDEHAWEQTLDMIGFSECTPFVGAGASAGLVPLASDLALRLAEKYGFPFEDTRDLARVTQFAAVREGSRQYVKQRFAHDTFARVSSPDYRAQDEPHGMLARLPLRIYITTNYDDFMYDALAAAGRSPQRAICPWYTSDQAEVAEATKLFSDAAGYDPAEKRPIVYHLHGHRSKPQSLVLTEDDYIDFLVRVSNDPGLLPPVIKESLTSKMLLFIGYGLADWTFRVIFRGLLWPRPSMGDYPHVSVQLPPSAGYPDDDRPPRIQEYLERYFERQSISICWQTAQEFSAELRRRWDAR